MISLNDEKKRIDIGTLLPSENGLHCLVGYKKVFFKKYLRCSIVVIIKMAEALKTKKLTFKNINGLSFHENVQSCKILK